MLSSIALQLQEWLQSKVHHGLYRHDLLCFLDLYNRKIQYRFRYTGIMAATLASLLVSIEMAHGN